MAKGEKFLEFTTYLEKTNQDNLKLTFPEIENIIGFKLPNSAYSYPAIWSNSESHSFAFGWLNAGYQTRNVDVTYQTVEFVRLAIGTSRIQVKKDIRTIRNTSLNIDLALENISSYYKETIADEHGRYKSWEHCYQSFSTNRNSTDDKVEDYLALHLAFYLASWGMYRGSSFLLQKDYKIHKPIVKIIQEKKYNPLFGITAEELQKEKNLNLLDEISNRIKQTYANEKPSLDGVINNATDTLITKILLGTLGCVPAYDRYYVQSVKQYDISAGNYNRNSVRDVAQYYVDNKNEFEILRKNISTDEIEYPPMKLMDMCMWKLGFDGEE